MRIYLIVFLFGVSAFLLPSISDAAGIVPAACTDGQACQTCHFVELVTNIVNWLVTILATLCALVIAFAGLKMVTAGGDPGAISEARGMITNVVVGFIIILSAWLVVDTVMKMFVNESRMFGPWNQIQCAAQPVVQPAPAPGTAPIAVPGTGCVSCNALPSTIPTNGNACSGGGTCQMNSDMAARLTALQSAGVNGWRVSEAWPPAGYSTSDPSGIHAESCHGTATCVDVSFNANRPSASQINQFTTNAQANNLTVKYEVPTQARAQELRDAGVSNVLVVPGINREHYSVYMCDIDSTPRACR